MKHFCRDTSALTVNKWINVNKNENKKGDGKSQVGTFEIFVVILRYHSSFEFYLSAVFFSALTSADSHFSETGGSS